jgi:hypothetical protein
VKANSRKMKISDRHSAFVPLIDLANALLVGTLSVALFYSRSGWNHVKANMPVMYFGDPIYYANLVHNSQQGNPLIGKNLGGPLGQQLNLTAYGFEWVQSWVVSLFASASSGPWLAMNRFLLFTFFITGFSSYISFRWLKINRFIAVVCALSFSLIPDHQPYDVGLANMSALAVTLAILWKIATGTRVIELFDFGITKKWSLYQRRAWNISIFLIIGIFQLTAATYYLLLPTLLAGSLLIYFMIVRGKKSRIINLIIYIAVQLGIIFVCLGPLVVSRMLAHLPFSETSTGDRRPFAAYANGGDLFALVSPLRADSAYAKLIGHLPKVQAFFQEYWNSPLTNGSEYIVHSGGILFFFLLLVSLVYFYTRGKTKNIQKFTQMIRGLELEMILVLFFLTLGWYLRGGLGTFLSFLFPYVRGYARYSSLLTFFGLAILGILSSKISETYLRKAFLVFLLLVFIDNSSAIQKVQQMNSTSMIRIVGVGELAGASTLAQGIGLHSLGFLGTQNLDLVSSQKLSPGCTVLELPLVTYPVDFAIGITSYYTYELIKPGLENSSVKWSAGGISGSPNNQFSDHWIGQYQTGDYHGFLPAIEKEKYCGILVFRGVQQAFFEAGIKNGSYYGPATDLTKQLIGRFGNPCYSDIDSAVDLYCLKKSGSLRN